MPLKNLHIQNFRNLGDSQLSFSPGLNILQGENAQGKTNLLEAVYYLANGSSFRTREFQSLPTWEQNGFSLLGDFSHGDLNSQLSVGWQDTGKHIELNGKKLRGWAKVHELFRVLVFTPESTGLFRTAPGTRRRYFDQAIGVHRTGYPANLGRYSRVLRQRNQLLETRASPQLLESFDQQWAELALAIDRERREYLSELLPRWSQRWASLFRGGTNLTARWEGRLVRLDEVEEYLAALRETSEEEQRYGRTVLGPGRDDLAVFLGGNLVREVASQGQQRMLVIALKLAEADIFQDKTGHSPLFLLDDIGSELDPRHLDQLLGILGELHAQSILTTTTSGDAWEALAGERFWVESGRVRGTGF